MANPKTEKEFAKYFTVDNYFTPNEMEYRKSMATERYVDFAGVLRKVENYREKVRRDLFSTSGEKFVFSLTKELHERVERIKSFWRTVEYVLQGKYAQKLIFDTLISESFSSSTIEGAYSTKKRTIELISKSLLPEDKSEKMIVNNYHGMEYLSKRTDLDLTRETILELHKIVSSGTLDDAKDEGVFRNGAVDIMDGKQKVVFSPTGDIAKMYMMIGDLIDFVNDSDEFSDVVDCAYKAMLFHFVYGFIHPHFDGNGRTLRALFTHILVKCGYDMFRFISLSEMIVENRKEYEKAYLAVERNKMPDGTYDVTYFFYFITNMMIKGLDTLSERVHQYTTESIMLDKASNQEMELTETQKRIIRTIAKSKIQIDTEMLSKRLKLTKYTIRAHVNFLVDIGIVKKIKAGRKYYFKPDTKGA